MVHFIGLLRSYSCLRGVLRVAGHDAHGEVYGEP
jgi:hypothetical protein